MFNLDDVTTVAPPELLTDPPPGEKESPDNRITKPSVGTSGHPPTEANETTAVAEVQMNPATVVLRSNDDENPESNLEGISAEIDSRLRSDRRCESLLHDFRLQPGSDKRINEKCGITEEEIHRRIAKSLELLSKKDDESKKEARKIRSNLECQHHIFVDYHLKRYRVDGKEKQKNRFVLEKMVCTTCPLHDYILQGDGKINGYCGFSERSIHILIAKRLKLIRDGNSEGGDIIRVALDMHKIRIHDEGRKYRVDGESITHSLAWKDHRDDVSKQIDFMSQNDFERRRRSTLHYYCLQPNSDPRINETCRFTEKEIHEKIAQWIECSRSQKSACDIELDLTKNGIFFDKGLKRYRVDGKNAFPHIPMVNTTSPLHDYVLEGRATINKHCQLSEESIHILIARRLELLRKKITRSSDLITAFLDRNKILCHDVYRKYRIDGINQNFSPRSEENQHHSTTAKNTISDDERSHDSPALIDDEKERLLEEWVMGKLDAMITLAEREEERTVMNYWEEKILMHQLSHDIEQDMEEEEKKKANEKSAGSKNLDRRNDEENNDCESANRFSINANDHLNSASMDNTTPVQMDKIAPANSPVATCAGIDTSTSKANEPKKLIIRRALPKYIPHQSGSSSGDRFVRLFTPKEFDSYVVQPLINKNPNFAFRVRLINYFAEDKYSFLLEASLSNHRSSTDLSWKRDWEQVQTTTESFLNDRICRANLQLLLKDEASLELELVLSAQEQLGISFTKPRLVRGGIASIKDDQDGPGLWIKRIFPGKGVARALGSHSFFNHGSAILSVNGSPVPDVGVLQELLKKAKSNNPKSNGSIRNPMTIKLCLSKHSNLRAIPLSKLLKTHRLRRRDGKPIDPNSYSGLSGQASTDAASNVGRLTSDALTSAAKESLVPLAKRGEPPKKHQTGAVNKSTNEQGNKKNRPDATSIYCDSTSKDDKATAEKDSGTPNSYDAKRLTNNGRETNNCPPNQSTNGASPNCDKEGHEHNKASQKAANDSHLSEKNSAEKISKFGQGKSSNTSNHETPPAQKKPESRLIPNLHDDKQDAPNGIITNATSTTPSNVAEARAENDQPLNPTGYPNRVASPENTNPISAVPADSNVYAVECLSDLSDDDCPTPKNANISTATTTTNKIYKMQDTRKDQSTIHSSSRENVNSKNVPLRLSQQEQARPRGCKRAASFEEPFEIVLNAKQPLGGYFRTDRGQNFNTKCIIFSKYAKGQLASDVRLKVGTQITAVMVGEGMVPIYNHLDLLKRYSDAKQHQKHLRLIVHNTPSCKQELQHISNGNWSSDGKWIGKATNGWTGGSSLEEDKALSANPRNNSVASQGDDLESGNSFSYNDSSGSERVGSFSPNIDEDTKLRQLGDTHLHGEEVFADAVRNRSWIDLIHVLEKGGNFGTEFVQKSLQSQYHYIDTELKRSTPSFSGGERETLEAKKKILKLYINSSFVIAKAMSLRNWTKVMISMSYLDLVDFSSADVQGRSKVISTQVRTRSPDAALGYLSVQPTGSPIYYESNEFYTHNNYVLSLENRKLVVEISEGDPKLDQLRPKKLGEFVFALNDLERQW